MYSIYYHIPSRLKFCSVDKSAKTEELSGVINLVDRMKWKNDSVFIYDNGSTCKISISLSDDKSAFILEFLTPSGIYWKELSRDDLCDALGCIDKWLKNPEIFGMESDTV